MYLAVDDVAPLSAMLNADEEIAFIVTDGPKRWKAILGLATLPMGRMGMWHIPSGPLPLLAREEKDDGWVHDPFSGWNELRTDPTTPPISDLIRALFGWICAYFRKSKTVLAACHPSIGLEIIIASLEIQQ